MITFSLSSPALEIEPGSILFEVTVTPEFPDLLTVNFFELLINGVSVEFTTEEALDVYTLSTTQTINGPQTLELSVIAAEVAVQSKTWVIEVSSERQIRVQDYLQSPYLPRLLNYVPDNIKASFNSNSIFQQLLNPVALELERIETKLLSFNRALDIRNPDLVDPDWLYDAEYEAEEIPLDTIPSIFGISGVNKLALDYKPSFREFWDTCLPSRFSIDRVIDVPSEIILPETTLKAIDREETLRNPIKSRLYLEISNSENLIDMENPQNKAELIINGLSKEGASQSERVQVFRDGILTTRKQWSTIESIQNLTADPDADCSIVIHGMYPQLARKLDTTTKLILRDRTEPIEWDVSVDEEGTCLDLVISEQGYFLDIAKGEDTRDVQKRVRLLTVNEDPVFLSDFVVIGNKIYGLFDQFLYIWTTQSQVFTKLALLDETDSPEQDFELVVYTQPALDEGVYTVSLEIEKLPPRRTSAIRDYSWSIISPSGTTTYIDPTTGVTSAVPLILNNPFPLDYFGLKHLDFQINLTALGDYLVQLEVTLLDGTTQKAQKGFSFEQRTAIAQYPLSHLVAEISDSPRLGCDDGLHLTILDRGTATILTPAYDVFLLDQDSRKLFFREDYSLIEISNAS